MDLYLEKKAFINKLDEYVSSLDVNHQHIYKNLKQQIMAKREKSILDGNNMYHQYSYNVNMLDKYKEMTYYIDREIIINEKGSVYEKNITPYDYFTELRSRLFDAISKQISDTVKEMGPEVYYVILNTVGINKFIMKQCSLVSKRFREMLKTIHIKVGYNTHIYCYNHCENKMYVDADTVYYYSCMNKQNYQNHILFGIPTCPICLKMYVRLQPDDTVEDYLAWNKCGTCQVLFIDGMYKGDHLKCKPCRKGCYKYSNNIVTIKDNNFIW